MAVLALLFFGVATIYSAVGFGGGSSYIALLAAADLPYGDIPKIGLICNLIVTLGGSWHFGRKGFIRLKTLVPLLAGSIPCAFVGGAIPVSKPLFLSVLGISLCCAGVRLVQQSLGNEKPLRTIPAPLVRVGVGMAIGLLSGITGIGGGIFLSPLFLNLKWGAAKEVAGLAAVFICLNSTAGLGGQILKGGVPSDIVQYAPLFAAVFLGGQIGARLGVKGRFSPRYMIRITGVLVLLVGLKSAADGIKAIQTAGSNSEKPN